MFIDGSAAGLIDLKGLKRTNVGVHMTHISSE